MAARPRLLVVFDFDLSLIDDNCDTFWVQQLLGRDWVRLFRSYHDSGVGWLPSVNAVLRAAHERAGVSAPHVRHALRQVRCSAGALNVLKYIAAPPPAVDVTAVIISDANQLFIEWILPALGPDAVAAIRHVCSNPATVSADGLVQVQPHFACHEPDAAVAAVPLPVAVPPLPPLLDAAAAAPEPPARHGQSLPHGHRCSRRECPARMCKATALSAYLQADPTVDSPALPHTDYDCIVFVGDGKGDLCACLALRPQDVVLARKDYPLHKALLRADCRAHVRPWTTADIYDQFIDIVQSCLASSKL